MTILGSALLSLLPPSGIGLPPTTDLTSGGLVWSFPAGLGDSSVLFGERGGQVLVHSISTTEIRLLSSYDSNPPAPVWQDWSGLGGAAASDTDVFLSADLVKVFPGKSLGIITKRTSSSTVAEWSHAFEGQFVLVAVCAISRDGSVIVASISDMVASDAELRVLDPATGAAIQTIPFPGGGYRIALSPEGSVAAVSDGHATGGMTRVMDLGAGTEIFSTPGTLPRKQGLSDGGRVLLVQERRSDGTTHSKAFVREGGSYREVLDVRGPTHVFEDPIAVSDDGSVVAGAWYHVGSPGTIFVRAFDVSTGTMTMERALTVPLDDFAKGVVAISSDGSRFVIGSSEDGAGLASELALYSPTHDAPLVEYPEGGSVLDVDMAPDGERFAASRSPHRGGGSTSAVELYETGGEDLVVRGRPSIGETVEFALHAAPGASAFLLSAPRLAPDPFVVQDAGTLHLGPSLLDSAPIGVVPPSGVATHPLVLANDPALVGRTTYFQGLTTGPRTLSHDWVQLTILP